MAEIVQVIKHDDWETEIEILKPTKEELKSCEKGEYKFISIWDSPNNFTAQELKNYAKWLLKTVKVIEERYTNEGKRKRRKKV